MLKVLVIRHLLLKICALDFAAVELETSNTLLLKLVHLHLFQFDAAARALSGVTEELVVGLTNAALTRVTLNSGKFHYVKTY